MYRTNDETLGMTVDEFSNEWYNKEDYMFVDIREDDEISNDGSLKGAFTISMYDIPDKIDMVPTYLSLIICCTAGERAEQVAKFVQNHGYNNVFFLEGGTTSLFEVIPELKG